MTRLNPVRLRRKVASIEAAAIAGIVCAVGWSLALRVLLNAPAIGASDADVVHYYADKGRADAVMWWLQVLVISTISFLWFVGVVRGRLGNREPRLFGTVFFGSAIMLAGLLFVGAALLAAPSVLVSVGGKPPGAEAASLTRATAATILSVFAPRIATLVMFSTASLGRVTRALPRWLVWFTFILGVGEFVNVSVNTPAIHVVPFWIALVSVVLLIRRPPNGFELAGSAPGS
ncbi:MAG: hypothetical protein WCI22_12425 [Actinomycetota bacterium]